MGGIPSFACCCVAVAPVNTVIIASSSRWDSDLIIITRSRVIRLPGGYELIWGVG
jgi:hypothetical protein